MGRGVEDTTALLALPRLGRPVASADGEVVVVPVTTTADGELRATLHLVTPDGDVTPLTDPKVHATGAAVSPGGTRLAHVRTDGDDRRQVHVLPLDGDGDDVRRVTDLPTGVLGSPRWIDERRLLVVTTLWAPDPSLEATAAWVDRRAEGPAVHVTERRVHRVWDTWFEDDATQHVLLVDTGDEDAVPVDLTPGAWLLPDPLRDPGQHLAVSPDGALLVFTTAAAAGDQDGVPVAHLRVVPLAGARDGGGAVDLTPDAPGPVGAPAFLPDGRVVVTIARERDFYAAPRDLWAIDPVTGEREVLIGDVDHGVDDVAVSADGRIVLATTLRGRGRLLEVVDGRTSSLGGAHDGSLTQPLVTTGALLAVASSVTSPPALVEVDGPTVRVRHDPAADALGDAELGELEERTVVGARGDDVQVLVLHPPSTTVDGDGPPPLLHLVHGGPHGCFGDEWHWRWNAARFAAEGWVVAMVNFHGSTGFGHEFTRSIHGDWATMPTQDLLAATDALVEDGTADPDRVAIAGGSYGGYLVTWLCTVTDRFVAAVAHAAVTDAAGMWASDHTSSLADAFGGVTWEDPSVHERSPASRYGRITTPMLVVHGDRDLRVPIDQGRALFGALQALGVESRLVVFPDEHHWVLDPAAAARWYDEVIAWLHRFLDR